MKHVEWDVEIDSKKNDRQVADCCFLHYTRLHLKSFLTSAMMHTGSGPMQRRAGELRQDRKVATVAEPAVCRRLPGPVFFMKQAYEVIARRWRPRQFDEIAGQEHIVRTLKNAIQNNRLAHAYLFVGPRGTGKTTTARIFAKALNCEGGPRIDPDNDSQLCKSIMNGSCMDVIEIDGASNNSVDQVRQLREDCQYAPSQCVYKIYIIDEVHMLSTAAFNALLKTLEEPPAHVKFLFATTEAHKVLATITSRCQRFEFRPLSDDLIVERLSTIASKESIQVEEVALRSIARMAQGGMRDAQSILDQLISFCGNQIQEKDVLDVYGLVSNEEIRKLVQAMLQKDYPSVIACVDRFANEGRDLYRLLLDIQAEIRARLIGILQQDQGGDSASTSTSHFENSPEMTIRMLEQLNTGETALREGLSDKVNFEVTLLRAMDQSRIRSIDTVLKSLSETVATLPAESGPKKK